MKPHSKRPLNTTHCLGFMELFPQMRGEINSQCTTTNNEEMRKGVEKVGRGKKRRVERRRGEKTRD